MNIPDELLLLAKHGYRILPVQKASKVPMIAQWTKRASTNVDVIKNWFESYPNCNWGLATGVGSNVIVVDIDPRHGGDAQWQRIELKFGACPKTTTCKTGGGGVHYYFQCPAESIGNSQLSAYPGVDIRGNNGQVIIPPSINATGGRYEWIYAPWDVEPAPAPEWLIHVILDDNAEQNVPVIGEQLVEGKRNDTIYHHALMLARQGALKEFVLSAMIEWCRHGGGHDISPDELNKTVTSAFSKVEHERTTQVNQPILKTDSDNADRLVRLNEARIRYAPGVGWLVWNNRSWEPDDENAAIINLATQSMVILRDDALEKAKIPEQFKTAISEAAWATTSLNLGKLNAAVTLAGTKNRTRLSVNSLDSVETKFLLNTQNGTVDLRTGNMQPHDPSLLITRMAPVNYNPSTECPFWLHTLELAFDGDQSLISYLQRALGYTLTGSVAEQCMFICWGEQGNNGKSTILETVQWMLGNYAQMSDVKVITSPEMDNRVASSLAKLLSVRAVFMNEADENQRFSEALIKQLTGGDTLQACKKFKEPFEYKPQFKLWVRTNEKPAIRGISDAIWRRIKLIPFTVPIPAEKRRSRDEVDTLLTNEMEGILNWMVKGAIEWGLHGLQDPTLVKSATSGYRSEMDTLEAFFDECVTPSTGASIARIDLYQAFVRWSKENGIRYAISADGFGKRMNRKLGNPPRVKEKGQFIWQGLSLSEYARSFLYT